MKNIIFLSAPVLPNMGYFPVENGELAVNDPQNYWGSINNSIKLFVENGVLKTPEGFEKVDLGQKVPSFIRKRNFALIFWKDHQNGGVSPVCVGDSDGFIEPAQMGRFSELAKKYIHAGSTAWEKKMTEFTNQSYAGFQPLVAGTNILHKELNLSAEKKLASAGEIFQEVYRPSWMKKVLLQPAEVLSALKGAEMLEITERGLITLNEGKFFGSCVSMDYFGSESLSATEAFQSLNFDTITPTGFSVKKIPTGYILRRKLGNQFLLKGGGSWFICDPRRGVLKTINIEQIEILMQLIQDCMENNWNATSYECPNFFKDHWGDIESKVVYTTTEYKKNILAENSVLNELRQNLA